MSVFPEFSVKQPSGHRPISCLYSEESPSPLHRRFFQRIHPYWLNCDRGLILDISADGIRLLTKRRLRGFVELRLWDGRRGINHKAEVRWSRRIAFRQWENGLQFINFGPEVAHALAEIAAHDHG